MYKYFCCFKEELQKKSKKYSFVLFYAFTYLLKTTPVFISKVHIIPWIYLTEQNSFF